MVTAGGKGADSHQDVSYLTIEDKALVAHA